ncbi:MAG: hypothetical protein NTV84_01170 [Methanoregula sp.]|nr:hypothetical protein [Methanoregula sp.]
MRAVADGNRWDRMRGRPGASRPCIARSSGIEGDAEPGTGLSRIAEDFLEFERDQVYGKC